MRVIAIDLDKCALLFPEKVNALYDNKDNVILIYSARNPKIREETEKLLSDKEIQYHALVLGKLRADIYIDDKNVGGLKWPEEYFYTVVD